MEATALRQFAKRGGFSASICGNLMIRRGDWDFEISAAALINSGLSDFPLISGDRFEVSESAVPCMTNDEAKTANVALRDYLKDSRNPKRTKITGKINGNSVEPPAYIIRVSPAYRF